jgi:hypothetical protein
MRVNASSLFAAAHTAIQEWAKLSSWIPNATVTVEAGGNVWRVKSHRVVEWAHNRHGGQK